jgi:hypothetical protein
MITAELMDFSGPDSNTQVKPGLFKDWQRISSRFRNF